MPTPERAPRSSASPALRDRATIGDSERDLQAGWRARYAPEVQEIVVRREVPSPKMTLVVVSYRAKDYLVECLQHLRGQTLAGRVPYEILLADSGGIEHLRDRTAPLVDVEVRLTDGISLNRARNAAMAWARGEYVAFIDDDGLVAPTFVEVACRVLEDPNIAALRGRIVAKEHPYFCTLAGHYDRGEEIVDDVLATEGHMAIRRSVYLETGGFPDDFYGAEGVYLVHRIHKDIPGARVVYVPDLVMRHDYFTSWRHFIYKTRRYTTIRGTVAELAPDPEFQAYLEAYHRREMPRGSLTPELRVARALLKAAKWTVQRVPLFDRVGRPG